jgi:hypothetical protein
MELGGQQGLKCNNISNRTEIEKILLQKRSRLESFQTKWLQDDYNYWDVPVFGYMRVRVCYENIVDEVDGNGYEVTSRNRSGGEQIRCRFIMLNQYSSSPNTLPSSSWLSISFIHFGFPSITRAHSPSPHVPRSLLHC